MTRSSERGGGILSSRSFAASEAGSGPLIDWLLSDARRLDRSGSLLEALCARLSDIGLPIWRVTLHLPQLHPQLYAVGYEWLTDTAQAVELRIPRQMVTSMTYHHSPIGLLHRSGRLVRRRLSGADADIDFPMLEELRDRGGTDYALVPMPLGSGKMAGIGLASQAADGFADADIALVEAIAPALSAVCEIRVAEQTATSLLDTYVGHDAARRILSGQITLGSSRSIEAVIFFCDLRGFTASSETLNREALLSLLNDFFACMVGPVHAAGGEVLKYMGDGMLAIFPLGDGDTAAACATALRAARSAAESLAAVSRQRLEAGRPEARAGIALHVGTVLYGNIGAEDRLDFTVIGRAVNWASRIESLSGGLGEPILTSSVFADFCGEPLRSVGTHRLRGVAEPQEVFAPAEPPPP